MVLRRSRMRRCQRLRADARGAPPDEGSIVEITIGAGLVESNELRTIKLRSALQIEEPQLSPERTVVPGEWLCSAIPAITPQRMVAAWPVPGE